MTKYILVDSKNCTRHGNYIFPGGSSFSSDESNKIIIENASEMGVSPLVAIMLNPWHAQLEDSRMLEIRFTKEADDSSDPIFRMSVREVGMPAITTDQKIIFALMVIMDVYKNDHFNQWAQTWISGTDRGAVSAGQLIAKLGKIANEARVTATSLSELGVTSAGIDEFCGQNNDFCARASESIFAAQMYVDRADSWPLLASRSVGSAVTGLGSRVDFAAIANKAIGATSHSVMRTRVAA